VTAVVSHQLNFKVQLWSQLLNDYPSAVTKSVKWSGDH